MSGNHVTYLNRLEAIAYMEKRWFTRVGGELAQTG